MAEDKVMITRTIAKLILWEMFETGKSADEIIAEEPITQAIAKRYRGDRWPKITK